MTTLVFGGGSIAEALASSLCGSRLIASDSLMTEDEVDQCFDDALQDGAVIHAVVFVHNECAREAFSDLSTDKWRRLLSEAVKRPFLIVRRAIEEFLGEGNGGRIITVVPDVFSGALGHTHNAACATALHGFSRSIAKEYGRRGITSNVVAYPLGDADANVPAIAEATQFLLDESSEFITGDLVHVGAQ